LISVYNFLCDDAPGNNNTFFQAASMGQLGDFAGLLATLVGDKEKIG